MSDEIDSFEIDQKFREELNGSLNEYEKQLGLEAWKNIEAPSYLNIDIAELRKKTPEELSEAIYLLNQYSLNIQRAINRQKSWERWAKLKIDQVSCVNFANMTNVGWNERMVVARNGCSTTKKLQHFLLQISMRLDRLYMIPDHIKMITDSIRDMKFTAIRREKTNAEN